MSGFPQCGCLKGEEGGAAAFFQPGNWPSIPSVIKWLDQSQSLPEEVSQILSVDGKEVKNIVTVFSYP